MDRIAEIAGFILAAVAGALIQFQLERIKGIKTLKPLTVFVIIICISFIYIKWLNPSRQLTFPLESPEMRSDSQKETQVDTDEPVATATWQSAVEFVNEFYQQLNIAYTEVSWAAAWGMETSAFQVLSSPGGFSDFWSFWSTVRVGYHLFGCDKNEVEAYIIFFNRNDDGYDFPLAGSERKLHISLLQGGAGFQIAASRDIEQITCEYALSFQADSIDE